MLLTFCVYYCQFLLDSRNVTRMPDLVTPFAWIQNKFSYQIRQLSSDWSRHKKVKSIRFLNEFKLEDITVATSFVNETEHGHLNSDIFFMSIHENRSLKICSSNTNLSNMCDSNEHYSDTQKLISNYQEKNWPKGPQIFLKFDKCCIIPALKFWFCEAECDYL